MKEDKITIGGGSSQVDIQATNTGVSASGTWGSIPMIPYTVIKYAVVSIWSGVKWLINKCRK